MPARTLTVSVPENLLKRIRSRAKQSKRTLEDEVVSLLNSAVSDEECLPPDTVEAMARVEHVDDKSLRQAVTPILSRKQAQRLADLNYKAQDEGLTAVEKVERDELLHIADKSMLVRAAVLAELHKRGADVSKLIAP